MIKRMCVRRFRLGLLLLIPAVCPADADPTVQWTASVVSTPLLARGSAATVQLSADVQAGWHVYALTQPPGGPTELRVTLDDDHVARLVGVPAATNPQKKHDPSFDLETQFYTHSFVVRLPIRVQQIAAGRRVIPVSVRFQSCSERECLPPNTVHLAVPIEVLP